MLYPLQPLGVALNLLFIPEIFFHLITKLVPVRKSNGRRNNNKQLKKIDDMLPITNVLCTFPVFTLDNMQQN